MYDPIYSALRDRICLLDYPPGSILSENVLAAEFHVSRTPIRQALQRLEFEGFVIKQRGIGTQVTALDLPYVRQMYTLRLALADFLSELPSQHINEACVTTLEGLLIQLEGLHSPHTRVLGELFMRFHEVFISATGSRILMEVMDRLFYHTIRIWVQLLPELSWEEELRAVKHEIHGVVYALQHKDMHTLAKVRREAIEHYLLRINQYMSL